MDYELEDELDEELEDEAEYPMSKEMKHFEKEYWEPQSSLLKEKILQYIKEHRAELTEKFVANFRELCQKIIKMQNVGEKGKIAYITYSFGVDQLQRESQAYQVEAYGEDWFFEDDSPCRVEYDVSWLYNLLEEMYQKLSEISKKYLGKITSADLAHIWKDEILLCDVRLLDFAKKAIKEAILLEEFQAIAKEEVLEIRLGQYKGYNEIIKKLDTRVKGNYQIKSWLEKKERGYSNSIFHQLDLSEGDYSEIVCYCTEFDGANLSWANFANASLIESSFVKAVLKGANFTAATLSQTDFHETLLEEVNMRQARLRDAEFQNSRLLRVNLMGAKCHYANFSNCVFQDCRLEGVTLSDANLTGADLHQHNLNKASFIGANLSGANLSMTELQETEFIKTILIGADLSGADLTGAIFRNFDFTQDFKFTGAKFGGNQFSGEVKIYAKDLIYLNLTEAERQKLTIVK